jgi:hypothetical protein
MILALFVTAFLPIATIVDSKSGWKWVAIGFALYRCCGPIEVDQVTYCVQRAGLS